MSKEIIKSGDNEIDKQKTKTAIRNYFLKKI